jgi:hypothetical protein
MVSRKLGFAVKVVGEPGLPSHDTRRWQSKPHLSVSLERLRGILEYLARVEIGMYRLPSGLVPYATHPDLPQFHGQLEACAAELADVGARANELGIRLSSHPAQFVVLNSASESSARRRRGTSSCRRVCSMRWASARRPSWCCTWAARRAGTRRAWCASCALSSSSPNVPARGS